MKNKSLEFKETKKKNPGGIVVQCTLSFGVDVKHILVVY
jgi:hypothetical protein